MERGGLFLFFKDDDDFVDLAEILEGIDTVLAFGDQDANVAFSGLPDGFFAADIFVVDFEGDGQSFFDGDGFADIVGEFEGGGVLLFGGFDGVVADLEGDDDVGQFHLAKTGIPRFAVFFFVFDVEFDDADFVDAITTGGEGGFLDDFGFEDEFFDLAEAFERKGTTIHQLGGNARSGVGAHEIALGLITGSAVVVVNRDGKWSAFGNAEGVTDVPLGGAGVVDFVGGELFVLADLDLDEGIGCPSTGAGFAEILVFKVFGVILGTASGELKFFAKAGIPTFAAGFDRPHFGTFYRDFQVFDASKAICGKKEQCEGAKKGREGDQSCFHSCIS